MPNKIALAGYGQVGKDTASIVLEERGYKRWCLGDIIKRQLDQVIQLHFGFSAFTSVPEEKKKIRQILEAWGRDNHEGVSKEFYASLPEKCVNTRIMDARQAAEWTSYSGVIWAIQRPGVGPQTKFEEIGMRELCPFIGISIMNTGTVEQLHNAVLHALRLQEKDV